MVPVPYGAYPCACYRYYDYDPVYLNEYRRYASDDDLHGEYLERFVYGVTDHRGLLALTEEDRLRTLEADPPHRVCTQP